VAELLAEDDVAEHPRSTIASSVDADGKRARLRQLRAFVAGYQTCWIEAPRGDRPTDKDWMGSAEILQHLPSVAAAAVPLLRQGLRGKEFLWRLEVARALGRVGPAAAAAVPDLRRLTHSDFSPDRICAAEALWRIERRQREVLPLLVAAMKSPSSRVRGMAARALLVVENDEPGLLDADLHEAALKAAELPGVPSTLAIAARLEL
jgi:hypothetical protein